MFPEQPEEWDEEEWDEEDEWPDEGPGSYDDRYAEGEYGY